MKYLSSGYEYYAYDNFKPTGTDGMNLVKGEKVHIIDRSYDDWWLVNKESSGSIGWVPASYLIEEDNHKFQLLIKDRISSLPMNDSKLLSMFF